MSAAIIDISNEATVDNVDAALYGTRKARKRKGEAKEVLVSLLKNKPFFLPLTQDERRLLRVYATPTEGSP